MGFFNRLDHQGLTILRNVYDDGLFMLLDREGSAVIGQMFVWMPSRVWRQCCCFLVLHKVLHHHDHKIHHFLLVCGLWLHLLLHRTFNGSPSWKWPWLPWTLVVSWTYLRKKVFPLGSLLTVHIFTSGMWTVSRCSGNIWNSNTIQPDSTTFTPVVCWESASACVLFPSRTEKYGVVDEEANTWNVGDGHAVDHSLECSQRGFYLWSEAVELEQLLVRVYGQ